MRIALDLELTLEENAEKYFSKAKKSRHKLQGAKEALEITRRKLEKAQADAEKAREAASKKPPKKHWYHKYRWSRTRNGHLLVGGQNADANEALVKHHGQEALWVLHTDMAGSPFVLLFADESTDEDLYDASVIVACYSRAWARGISGVEVLHVKPEQVTKQAQPGEFLPKGAFMIRGETKYKQPSLELGIGVIEEEGTLPQVFAGSKQACEEHCTKYAMVIPGQEKTSDVAKRLQRAMGGELDDYVKALPPGGSRLMK